jgi:death on curing protein
MVGRVWYPILADVLALHDAMMRELGENPAPLMGDGRGKLESAINSCEAAAHYAEADLAEQAAVLAVRVAQAHAFVDNNKRVAYIATVIFLRENGHPLPAEHSMGLAYQIEGALKHTKTITDVAGWLRTVIGDQ